MTSQFDWSILLQIPLVAAFIWYSIEMFKQFRISMEKRDEAYLGTLGKISERLEQNTRALEKAIDCIEK